MRLTQKIKYNIKRAMPALVVAGAGFMTSCGNDDEPVQPRDIELEFYRSYSNGFDYSQIDNLDKLREYAADPTIANIYMKLLDEKSDFHDCETINIHYARMYMEERTNISPKIHGRGNFNFPVGVTAKDDSLWFVKQGWTINKHLGKQR